jgi:hypothetical protein
MTRECAAEDEGAFAHRALAWPGFNERGSLHLPLPWFPDAWPLPDAWDVDGGLLQRKDEFHMTLLSRREGALVRERLGDGCVEQRFGERAWTLGAMRECWYLASAASGKRSIIAAFECDALNAFRSAIATDAGIALAATIPHVTLYVGGEPTGIGLESIAEFEALAPRRVWLQATTRESGIGKTN